MYEDTDITVISYTNTDGELVELDKNSERIEWGDYRDENQLYRYFRIPLRENERLETETEVSIFLSKPSIETYVDVTARQTVIKGVNFEAYNITLDRYKINELSMQEELDALILQESRAQAANVLTEADMTDDFRIVETDLTREVDEDGSYFAVLEVGNKAYQLTVGIDVTSKLEHMRVTIPTKMVFESLYNTAESNRNFESQTYEIRNQSPLAVDTYVNQLAIDDSASIVLLEAGEDPLDYAESESEEEDPTLTYDDISTPLLRLNLKTEETQIQLYEAMEEQHLVRLEERSRVPISLTGTSMETIPNGSLIQKPIKVGIMKTCSYRSIASSYALSHEIKEKDRTKREGGESIGANESNRNEGSTEMDLVVVAIASTYRWDRVLLLPIKNSSPFDQCRPVARIWRCHRSAGF